MRSLNHAFLIGLLLLAWTSVAKAEPSISRSEIIDIAISGVGSRYVWGGGCWNPSDRSWRGADCSGYVAKCWQVPNASATTTCSHPYSTYNFYNERTYWDAISRDDLRRADSMVYRADGAGHIVLWASGDGWGNSEVYEARGTAYGIVHRTRTFSSSYRARRRHSIVADGPPPHPVLTLDLAIDTIDGQERDLCAAAGSEGLFDAYVGQELTERLYIANEGNAVAVDVVVGVEIDDATLQLLNWEIFDDWEGNSCGGSWCPNDANSNSDNPPHATPGESLVLYFNAMSPGETKMLVLDLTVLSDSFAAGHTPGIRFWVISVRDYYSKDSFDSAFNNVSGYQTFNDGDLRAETRHSFLDDELCNGLDDDCNGTVDDGFDVGSTCTVGVGACARDGLILCSEAGDASCDAIAGEPVDEDCANGLDDDCDGVADDEDEDCAIELHPEDIPEPPEDPEATGGQDEGVREDASTPADRAAEISQLTGSCTCRVSGRDSSSTHTLELLRSLISL